MTFTFYAELGLGANLTAQPSTWSWTDVTSDVGGSGIDISRGRQDRYSSAQADHCSLTLLNNGGKYVPKNPRGPFYGQLKRNTPLRIMIRPNVNSATDAFGRTVASGWGTADTGGAWSTFGTTSDYSVSTANGGRHTNNATAVSHFTYLSSLAVARSDVKVRIRVNALSTGDWQQAGVTCRYVDNNNVERAELVFQVGGAILIRLVSRAAGADSVTASVTASFTHSTSTWYWLRLQTGLTSARVKAWADGTAEPATWNIDGASGTMLVTTAAAAGTFTRRNAGNTNAAATTDFDDFTFADGPRTQFTGFVDEWPVRWADHALTQSYAPITASGQLRRISRFQELRSAIYRACTLDTYSSASKVVAYWPMEDGSSATMFAAAVGQPQGFSGMRPAASSQLTGSDPLPTMNADGSFRFRIPSYAASSTWAVRWAMAIPQSALSGGAQVMSWGMPGGNPIIRWQLTLVPGSPDLMRLEGYNWNASALFVSAGVNAVDPTSGNELANGRQLYFEANGVQNGANIDLTWACWFVPDDGSTPALSIGETLSTAATIANLNLIYHDAVTGFAGGGHTIGHVLVGTDTGVGAGSDGVTGGAGDTTLTRFMAVLSEQGIIGYFGDLLRGTGSTTQQMGPQRSRTVEAELQEIEATEFGRLYDGKSALLHLVPRAYLLSRPVDLTLNVASGHAGWPFEPTDDDYLLRNTVTVTNANSSSAVSIDKASIADQGVHAEAVTVNAYRDQGLQDHADWRRYAGTAGDMRYPAIVVNLTAQHVALASAWCDVDIGSRIQVTHVPSNELPPEDLDLLVDGYRETISSTAWTATVNASPYRGAGVWDGGKRYDCGACTIAEDLDTTETGIDVAIADTCTWVHTGVNFDIFIGGERMTVTAVSAAAGAGAAWTQTLTVARSTNSVVKTHTTGAEVHIADPFIWGF